MRVFRGLSQPAPSATVLTIGNFDGVHRGHRALLARLCAVADQAGLPPSVLTFEPHPREFFTPETAPTRLSTLREKLELLAADGAELAFVCHFNRAFASLAAEDFITTILLGQLRVRHLIIGDDFRFGARRTGDFAMLQAAGKSHGFVVEAMQTVADAGQRVSSSAIRAALAAGELETAAALLGRPYIIDGRVVHGAQMGRQLGFATANIYIKHPRPPLQGVFTVMVQGPDGVMRPGVANLGCRPTVNAVPRPLLEVHLLDFSADIYGAHLSVRFLHKLRNEMKFASLDALRQQIAADVAEARQYFKS